MTRLPSLLLVALLPLALAADDAKPPAKPDVFTSKAGRFSVAVPEAPAEKTSKVKVGDKEAELHVFSVKQKDRARLVTYIDYPAGVVGADKDKFLAGVVGRNVGALKGKVVANEKVTLGAAKHSGRDVRVEVPEGKRLYRARAYLVGNRLYQVVVLGPEEFAKGKEADAFLDSFAVTE